MFHSLFFQTFQWKLESAFEIFTTNFNAKSLNYNNLKNNNKKLEWNWCFVLDTAWCAHQEIQDTFKKSVITSRTHIVRTETLSF